MFEFLCRKLGWEPKQGESHLDAMLRGEILTALAVFGHDLTLNEASRRFHAFLDDRNTSLLPPDIRKVGEGNIDQFLVFLHLQFQWIFMDWVGLQAAYVGVMQRVSTSNRLDYESLLRVYRETDLSQEKTRILGNNR
jgi:puromycin-sensitive aminopeptidase